LGSILGYFHEKAVLWLKLTKKFSIKLFLLKKTKYFLFR